MGCVPIFSSYEIQNPTFTKEKLMYTMRLTLDKGFKYGQITNPGENKKTA
jgi:hypothetical protein